MIRLQTRLTVFVVTGIVLTLALLVGFQVASELAAIRRLDPDFVAAMDRIARTPDLSETERRRLVQALLVDAFQDDATFDTIVDGILSAIRGRPRSLLLAALVVLPFGVIAAAIIARAIARPILGVSRAAERIAGGDLAARAEPAPRRVTGGEIAALIDDFNAMAETRERLEHERRSMIADVAHELRTPLTVLQGQLDAMEDGVVPLDAEQVAKASRQAQLLARLVRDLRTLSLAEAARLELDRRPTDLAALLSDLVEGFRERADARGIAIAFASEGGELRADVDPERIAQVAINLLGNAVRHTPEGGRVEVRAAPAPGGVRFAVRDSGSGLDAETLRRAFDRFYRAEASRSRDASWGGAGSGLGLAISKAIVELHGGAITGGNDPELGGARFVVTLPAA